MQINNSSHANEYNSGCAHASSYVLGELHGLDIKVGYDSYGCIYSANSISYNEYDMLYFTLDSSMSSGVHRLSTSSSASNFSSNIAHRTTTSINKDLQDDIGVMKYDVLVDKNAGVIIMYHRIVKVLKM